ncbi:MAG TPA: FHA domain-containing protein [Polyangiaceae bacterium]|nr:FHA domain-containing protein [Polyangiaceae bacterium]
MRIVTPRATPIVRAPAPSVSPPSEGLREAPPLLRTPVSIITPISEVDLHEGSLLVGRLPECDVMIDDALVSRMHARVSVRDQSVLVEDLHSTNGVYVNGARITHSALLREGDRLLIGTTEISLFEARPDARVAPLRAKRESSPAPSLESLANPRMPVPTTVPAKRRESFGRLDLHLDELPLEHPEAEGEPPPSARPADLRALRDRRAGVPSTARADALEVIGALADRLAGSGNLDEARRVLSAHLKRILQGATAGLTVPDEVCKLASRHALSLARWTGQSTWIDYVVELHLAARRAMSPLTFPDFESALLSIGDFDHPLLAYYTESLRDERSLLTSDERQVLQRLIRLAER